MVEISQEIAQELVATAKALTVSGKGLLAADESTGTIGKRFASIDVENTEANRLFYRSLLFSTKGLGEYCSGVILYEETLYQKSPEGISMIELLKKENIIPGIKVDKGLEMIPGTDGEQATMGLDGLNERCKKYYELGARFAKWRSVIQIDERKHKPSNQSIAEVSYGLARYASICQQNKLVPIVEPEILTDGSHDIKYCAYITEKVLSAVFKELNNHNVLLEGTLLKPNMVTPGSQCPTKATPQDIAFYTLRTLSRTVPPALPGIMFLSGGQSEEDATIHLNAINNHLNAINHHNATYPWKLSFSYGRALQASTLKCWAGKPENKNNAQNILLQRAKANSDAQRGMYKGGAGGIDATTPLYEKKYIY